MQPDPIQQFIMGEPEWRREPTNENWGIREVWKHNLEDEFAAVREIVRYFPFVSMDTEFPGTVAKPSGNYTCVADYSYNYVSCNVNLLKVIQIGFSFFDEEGNRPPGISTWQFNLVFDLSTDQYAPESIELLKKSGIQFDRHKEEGIDPLDFSELLTTSGLVILEEVHFLSFHGGYDFGYLIKLLTDQPLPDEESKFFEILYLFFPVFYDVKYLMNSCKNLRGGLQDVSVQLGLKPLGPQHQAGFDAQLTGETFFRLREAYFEGFIDDEKYCGRLYGLGSRYAPGGVDDTDNNLNLPVGLLQQGGAAGAAAGNGNCSDSNNTSGTPTVADGGNADSADGTDVSAPQP